MAITDTVSNLIQIAKTLREVSDKIKDAEMRSSVADLSIALADLKLQVANLQEENLQLRSRVSDLEAIDDVRERLEVKEGVYWISGEPPKGRERGPYCTACMDARKMLVLLDTRNSGAFAAFGKFYCPQCKAHYAGGR